MTSIRSPRMVAREQADLEDKIDDGLTKIADAMFRMAQSYTGNAHVDVQPSQQQRDALKKAVRARMVQGLAP